MSDDDGEPPAWAGDLAFLTGNAVAGGLTAGLLQALRGRPFWPAARDGALGGAVAYAGRRLAAERFTGAGILGRQVAAVGSSLVRDASAGQPLFQEIVLPLGFVRLYLHGDTTRPLPHRARIKLDVPTFLATTYFVARSDAELDFGASLSAGTPVFTSSDTDTDEDREGRQAGGVIWLRGNSDAASAATEWSAVFAHERVHVLQYDFTLHAWSDPAESWLSAHFPGGAWVERHLDLGLHLWAWELANHLLPYDQRPWEHEAHFLSRVRSERE